MVNIEHKKPGLDFYSAWVLFSIPAFAIAFVAYFLFTRLYNAIAGDWITVNGMTHIAEDYLFHYIYWPLYGVTYGYLQYTLLRKHFPRMGWWILATAIGQSLTFLGLELGRSIASAFGIDPYSVSSVVIQLMLVGGFLGIAQWFVLRRLVSNALWWIPVNMVSWGAAALAGSSGFFVSLFLPAIATSITLYFLLRRSSVYLEQSRL
jgi:hypothetical protein